MSAPVAPDRTARVAAAGLSVLEREGGRGLTHRAVDRAAGLPDGSTSNVFRTRQALLAGIQDHLVALEVEEIRTLAAGAGRGPLGPDAAAELLAALVTTWTTTSAGRTVARLELFLEARRRPAFAAELRRAREAFVALTAGLLRRTGCTHPDAHARGTVALMDGLVADQLLHPGSRLDGAGLRAELDRMLRTC